MHGHTGQANGRYWYCMEFICPEFWCTRCSLWVELAELKVCYGSQDPQMSIPLFHNSWPPLSFHVMIHKDLHTTIYSLENIISRDCITRYSDGFAALWRGPHRLFQPNQSSVVISNSFWFVYLYNPWVQLAQHVPRCTWLHEFKIG